MSQYLDLIVAFVSSHGAVAYVVIFLSALLEAVPLAGSVVPGSTVILALSALVPSGNLKLAPILIAAIAGAALGDGLAYWLGYTQKRRVLSLWPMSKYPALIAESERFFLRYGTFAVFFPLRAADPGFRADHGRRARHAATKVLRHRCPGRSGLGDRDDPARRAGGVRGRTMGRESRTLRAAAGRRLARDRRGDMGVSLLAGAPPCTGRHALQITVRPTDEPRSSDNYTP